MNPAECAKYVKKDNVWKRPDYEALHEEGRDAIAVWVIKLIRDACPTAPAIRYSDKTDEKKKERQEEYISFVTGIRDKVMDLKTKEDVVGLKAWFYGQNYINRTGMVYSAEEWTRGLLTNKLARYLSTTERDFRWYEREMQNKQFLVPKEEKLPATTFRSGRVG